MTKANVQKPAKRRVKGSRGPASPAVSKVVEGVRTVDDPLSPGVKMRARVNLAEHPLELMRARGRIDDAQYEAGVRFRAIYERATIGGGGGIDPSRIRVDGGTRGDAFTDEVATALNDLRRLSRDLGMIGYRVMQAVAGQGETITSLAARWPGSDAEKIKQSYISLRFREVLDVLALDVWGVRGPERAASSAWRAPSSGDEG